MLERLVAAGAALGASGIDVLGISDGTSRAQLAPVVSDLVRGLAARLDIALAVPAEAVVVLEEYGGTYGVPTSACVEAIRLTARAEGLLLDPVYTGKAMAGLMDLVRQGRWRDDQAVVFWHTGGQPALFAYADVLGGASD